MNTREILSIVALAALGLCLLCGLAKMAMKGPKAKQSCDHACSLLVFVAVVLVGVSQLLEEEKYMTVPPNFYYAHKGNEMRVIDKACHGIHGKKTSLNDSPSKTICLSKSAGSLSYGETCEHRFGPGWCCSGNNWDGCTTTCNYKCGPNWKDEKCNLG